VILSGGLRLALDALTQHRSLRSLTLSGNVEDAGRIPDLLRAKTGLTHLNLIFPKLASDTIEAIVGALQSNSSLLKFDMSYQQLQLADNLAIDQVLRRNKEAAVRAVFATNSNGGSPALVSPADDGEALADTPSASVPYTTAVTSPVKPAAALLSSAPDSIPADAAAVPVMPPESLGAHVRSLGDMQDQLSQLQSSVQSHSSSLAPLSAEHQRRQAALSALRVIHSSESARGYHAHVRLLLTCAHVGAASLRSGNAEGSGSGAATAGVLAVEQLPKLIAKGLGKTAESIPLLGTGASVLTALIKAADARALNVKMQRVVLMARTPAELTALVDTLARRLTLLQWATVSSPAALAVLVEGSGFRGWAKAKLGEAKAHAMYAVKGERYLTGPQKAALADVERFLEAVAEDEPGLSFDCPPHVVGDEARADWLTLRVVRMLLPGRNSYDEQLPADVAAKPTPPPRPAVRPVSVVARPVAGVVVPDSATSPPSMSGVDVSALLEKMAQLEAREAEREAELQRVRADAEKHRKALAAHDAHIKKLQEQSPDGVDAGAGLAYAVAEAKSPLSPQAQREADLRTIHQLQQQVDTLTAQMAKIHQRAEEKRAAGRDDAHDEQSAAAEERRSQQVLSELRAQLLHRRTSVKQLEAPSI